MKKAFTLIELLIVVAIIAILAAIAVPNFLEAQTRAKVSRVKADQRTIATGLESYYVDRNRYPAMVNGGSNASDALFWLTTPISYLTSLSSVEDIFLDKGNAVSLSGTAFTKRDMSYSEYVNFNNFASSPFSTTDPEFAGWSLSSFGPDRVGDALDFRFYGTAIGLNSTDFVSNGVYDPSNGTISGGDVSRFGGSLPGFIFTLTNK